MYHKFNTYGCKHRLVGTNLFGNYCFPLTQQTKSVQAPTFVATYFVIETVRLPGFSPIRNGNSFPKIIELKNKIRELNK